MISPLSFGSGGKGIVWDVDLGRFNPVDGGGGAGLWEEGFAAAGTGDEDDHVPSKSELSCWKLYGHDDIDKATYLWEA